MATPNQFTGKRIKDPELRKELERKGTVEKTVETKSNTILPFNKTSSPVNKVVVNNITNVNSNSYSGQMHLIDPSMTVNTYKEIVNRNRIINTTADALNRDGWIPFGLMGQRLDDGYLTGDHEYIKETDNKNWLYYLTNQDAYELPAGGLTYPRKRRWLVFRPDGSNFPNNPTLPFTEYEINAKVTLNFDFVPPEWVSTWPYTSFRICGMLIAVRTEIANNTSSTPFTDKYDYYNPMIYKDKISGLYVNHNDSWAILDKFSYDVAHKVQYQGAAGTYPTMLLPNARQVTLGGKTNVITREKSHIVTLWYKIYVQYLWTGVYTVPGYTTAMMWETFNPNVIHSQGYDYFYLSSLTERVDINYIEKRQPWNAELLSPAKNIRTILSNF